MKLRFAVYNVEWMKNLFSKEGTPKQVGQGSADDKRDAQRSVLLAGFIQAIDPDILGVVEGPDTLKSGNKTASKQLEAWCQLHGLDANYKGVHGFASGGQRELCTLYRKNKVNVVHKPENEVSQMERPVSSHPTKSPIHQMLSLPKEVGNQAVADRRSVASS